MRKGAIDVADVAGLEVHGAGTSASGEDGHASATLYVVLPLILVGVPVKFAETAGLECDDGSSNVGGGKVFRVDNLDLATFGYLGGRHLAGEEGK